MLATRQFLLCNPSFISYLTMFLKKVSKFTLFPVSCSIFFIFPDHRSVLEILGKFNSRGQNRAQHLRYVIF